MDINTVIITLLSSGLIGFILKNIYTKLSDLDNRLRDAVSERQVRRLVDDKINPMCDDIREIKANINKMIDLYLTDHNKGNL